MLDGNFMKSGWVHDLKLHQFSGPTGPRFIIKGKVCVAYSQTLFCVWLFNN